VGRSLLALALSPALLLMSPAPLAAQPRSEEPTPLSAQEAVRFQYAAPAECPDVAVFTARVRERTPRGRLADPQELARTFDVKLAADASGFNGEIAFLDDAGNKVSRRLHGEQCDAVVTSLALITALALDATLRPEEPPAPPPTEPPGAAASPPAPVTQPPAPNPRAQAPQRSLSGARIGFTGGYDSAIGEGRLGLLGQLDWRGGFALRLAAHYGTAERADAEDRRALLRILGVEASVCPWRFRVGQLAFAPCAAFDVGTLHARGVLSQKLTLPDSDTIVWAAVGAELRLAWEVAAPVWVELHGGAAFPLVARHRFQFKNPTKDVYEVPRFSGSAGAALGVRF
jgi:hypothetical protein